MLWYGTYSGGLKANAWNPPDARCSESSNLVQTNGSKGGTVPLWSETFVAKSLTKMATG